ncbi:MAG: hypothetical protein ACE5Q3_08900 [Alphaproteobacteria bacterium]
MNDVRKFPFDTSFDNEAAPPKPHAQFTEDELQAACERAFAEGRQAGLETARQSNERRLTEVMEAAIQKSETLASEFEQRVEAMSLQSLEVAVAICRKVLPAMAEANALPEIEALVGESLTNLHDEPRVVIRVAADLVEAMEDRLDALCADSGFHGKLVILGDEEKQETDCAVVWADGGAERTLERIWKEIDQAVERLSREARGGRTEAPGANTAAVSN